MFRFEKTWINGLIVVKPFVFIDGRGMLKKSFEKQIFEENGIVLTAMEEIETTSEQGVLRGLHLQTSRPQAKLVRVARGELYDVAVDLRKGSETFGRWFGIRLSEENQKMLYIPEGFAHGCLALRQKTTFYYLCSQRYDKESDSGIVWNDGTLKITWPVEEAGQVILSEKDRRLGTFREFVRTYGGLGRQGEAEQYEDNFGCCTDL